MEGHTFLFADLVGYTALTEEHGDDRAVEVATAFHDCVRTLLARHAAEEIKAMGDAVMLRCDDPQAAVRLGLGIVLAVEEMPGAPGVRVGIASGPAVARHGDWYGRTVNLASRLCSAAGGGEVLVSAGTLESAESLTGVEVSDRRLHWLKNVTEPVTAFVVSPAALACEAGRGFWKRFACPVARRRAARAQIRGAAA